MYPTAALREMLLNALVHRDYLSTTVVMMRMFDERFNIWNDGPLLPPIDEDSLKKEHPSKPRNLLIADVCFKGGYIDAWGSGIKKILGACREAGLPEAEIVEDNGGVLVTLRTGISKSSKPKRLSLERRKVNAIQFVKENGSITNMEYQNLNKVSKRTASRDLQQLEKLLILVKQGTTGVGAEYQLGELNKL